MASDFRLKLPKNSALAQSANYWRACCTERNGVTDKNAQGRACLMTKTTFDAKPVSLRTLLKSCEDGLLQRFAFQLNWVRKPATALRPGPQPSTNAMTFPPPSPTTAG